MSERIKHLGSDETKGLTKGQNVGQIKSRNLGIPNTGQSQWSNFKTESIQ